MDLFFIVLIDVIFLLIFTILVLRVVYVQRRRMREQIKMKELFTNITHEILTPLTVVAASVELLRQHDDNHVRDFDVMDLNIQRVVRLLQQILETSKSEAGELKLRVSNGDVMTYIRETSYSMQPLMARQGLQFHILCKPDTMMGWIDTDKLDKILFNLLSNAAKYSGKIGEVWLDVSTNATYDQVTIQVRDNGVGIPADKMKHLFNRFYDGEYRKNHTTGTGLGLALTRDLVYLHGGNIHCYSEVGHGTTFVVNLPISKESFAAEQRDENTPVQISVPKFTIEDIQEHLIQTDVNAIIEPPDEDAYKILIVEDNAELLMLMKQLLSASYHVRTASNGKEALEVIHNNELDLIISDMMMPEMDGNELTIALKSDPDYSHLPIIILTAKTQEDDKAQALANGADEYIVKPFKLRDLRLRIDNIIENRQRIQHDFQTQLLTETAQPTEAHYVSADQDFLNRAIECVNVHISDADYDREQFASDMGASSSTLYNKLRSITGMSVSSFMRNIRMKAASDIVRQKPDIRVSDLAYKVGFRDPKYFATIFKKEFGMQPKEYIEQVASKGQQM